MTPLTQTFINWLNTHLCSHLCCVSLNLTVSLIAVVSTLAILFFLFTLSRLPKAFMLQLASRVCVYESWREQFSFRGFMFDTWAVWNTVASACRVNVFCTTNLSDAVCSSVCCHVHCAAEVCEKVQFRSFADVFFSVDLLALQCLREPSFPHSRWRWSLRCQTSLGKERRLLRDQQGFFFNIYINIYLYDLFRVWQGFFNCC